MQPKRQALNEPSEWLKVMLLEVDRKRQERLEAEQETARRQQADKNRNAADAQST